VVSARLQYAVPLKVVIGAVASVGHLVSRMCRTPWGVVWTNQGPGVWLAVGALAVVVWFMGRKRGRGLGAGNDAGAGEAAHGAGVTLVLGGGAGGLGLGAGVQDLVDGLAGGWVHGGKS